MGHTCQDKGDHKSSQACKHREKEAPDQIFRRVVPHGSSRKAGLFTPSVDIASQDNLASYEANI